MEGIAFEIQICAHIYLSYGILRHMGLHLRNSLSVIDMSTGSFQYGRPEQTLLTRFPRVFSRETYGQWANGGSLSERDSARECVRKILASTPPLEPLITQELENKLWKIIKEI